MLGFGPLEVEAVLLEEHWVLTAIDRRDLRFETDDESSCGNSEVLAHCDCVAPALQTACHSGGVVDVHHTLASGARRLCEADQEVRVTHIGQLFLVHVLEEEVLRVGRVIRRVRVDVTQVVGERSHVVIVVFRPTREVLAFEFAVGPSLRE